MPAFASTQQVGERWQRALTGDETLAAESLLEQASAMIRVNVPGIDVRVAGSADWATTVAGIVVDAVLRVLRNPEGFVAENEGPFGVRRSDAAAGGQLFFTDQEWAQLRGLHVARVLPTAYTVPLWGV